MSLPPTQRDSSLGMTFGSSINLLMSILNPASPRPEQPKSRCLSCSQDPGFSVEHHSPKDIPSRGLLKASNDVSACSPRALNPRGPKSAAETSRSSAQVARATKPSSPMAFMRTESLFSRPRPRMPLSAEAKNSEEADVSSLDSSVSSSNERPCRIASAMASTPSSPTLHPSNFNFFNFGGEEGDDVEPLSRAPSMASTPSAPSLVLPRRLRSSMPRAAHFPIKLPCFSSKDASQSCSSRGAGTLSAARSLNALRSNGFRESLSDTRPAAPLVARLARAFARALPEASVRPLCSKSRLSI
mmetsp:Transcript_19226/g.41371  ORF Transcript_19226/g.41371 Transcript_19226/m.41371 type:complete len:300 (+) Transcript_19226:125-1024(+)